MKALQSRLNGTDLSIISKHVQLMFKSPKTFLTAEALIVHMHNMLSDEDLLTYCEQEYGFELETPPASFVTKEVLDAFKDTDAVPIRLDNVRNELHIITLPEFMSKFIPPYKGYQVVKHRVPIYYYVEMYQEAYGMPDFLNEIPSTDLFDVIISEAVRLGAADITITTRKTKGIVYYNVRKKRYDSRIQLSKENVKDISEYIEMTDNKARSETNKRPTYPSIDLGTHHRGRVNIAHNNYGAYISIRVLPKGLFDSTLEELNLERDVIKFIRTTFMSDEKGLRVMIGPTYSGKNTTAISALYEKIQFSEYKAVSIESPVELEVEMLEQINCEDEEEFKLAADALIRQNPDIAYITEMTPSTALSTMNTANTGRVLISTIHANSIADLIPRIQDLTDLPLDRIILNLQSAVFQELRRNDVEDVVVPYNTYLHFDTELKDKLLGKTLGEIVQIVREEEAKCLL